MRGQVGTHQPSVRVLKGGGGGVQVSINPPKRDPAKRITGSHFPLVPAKLISTQSTDTQTKYQYTRQLLTKDQAWQGKGTKPQPNTTYYLEGISITQ